MQRTITYIRPHLRNVSTDGPLRTPCRLDAVQLLRDMLALLAVKQVALRRKLDELTLAFTHRTYLQLQKYKHYVY